MSNPHPVSIGSWEFATAVDWMSDVRLVVGGRQGVSSLDLGSHEVAKIEYAPELASFGFKSFVDRRVRPASPVRAILQNSKSRREYAVATISKDNRLELE